MRVLSINTLLVLFIFGLLGAVSTAVAQNKDNALSKGVLCMRTDDFTLTVRKLKNQTVTLGCKNGETPITSALELASTVSDVIVDSSNVVGIPGPKGDTGPIGPKGAVGPIGPVGPQGSQGAVGPVGATGVQGPQGVVGATGAPGAKGDVGPQGPKGDQGQKGAKGDKGDKGDKGAKGDKGDQGPAGKPNTSYAVCIKDNEANFPIQCDCKQGKLLTQVYGPCEATSDTGKCSTLNKKPGNVCCVCQQ